MQCGFEVVKTGIEYMRDRNFVWDPGTRRILGIKFSTQIKEISELNYADKLDKLKRTLHSWKKRQLSPLGKVTIIKSLIISSITHLLINIPDPPLDFLKKLEVELYDFLWNGKRNEIKKSSSVQTNR